MIRVCPQHRSAVVKIGILKTQMSNALCVQSFLNDNVCFIYVAFHRGTPAFHRGTPAHHAAASHHAHHGKSLHRASRQNRMPVNPSAVMILSGLASLWAPRILKNHGMHHQGPALLQFVAAHLPILLPSSGAILLYHQVLSQLHRVPTVSQVSSLISYLKAINLC